MKYWIPKAMRQVVLLAWLVAGATSVVLAHQNGEAAFPSIGSSDFCELEDPATQAQRSVPALICRDAAQNPADAIPFSPGVGELHALEVTHGPPARVESAGLRSVLGANGQRTFLHTQRIRI